VTANRQRGEVAATIDGAPRRLKLTLGALAELEDESGEDLAALLGRLERGRMTARDALRLIAAGLRGAGQADADAGAVARMTVAGGPLGGFQLAANLVAAAFDTGDVSPGKHPAPPERPITDDSPGGA
jgi:hypothetical protein